jgi:heterodisulfide reductase subunit C/nitrate reductase gamma subunit
MTWALRAALVAAVAGTLWRVVTWFTRWVGPAAARPGAAARVGAALRGLGATLVSPRLLRVLGAVLVDVLGGRRLVARDPVRGLAHLAIAAGFTALLVLHGLHAAVTDRLFKGAASTLNPWLWLRDLAGLLVLAGLVVSAARRRGRRRGLPRLRRRDPLFVALLVVVVASGFLLAAVKIGSARAFERMAKEYASASGEELRPLRLLWAAEYGVVFPGAPPPDAAALKAGRAMAEQSCTSCHVPPRAAFVSYPLARAVRPAAGPLDRADAARWLLQLHLLACCVGLAYLPVSRFFHVVADPVSLLARAGARPGAAANRPTRRALALDACVRCGLCDERCAVRALAALTGNELVLPSAKLLATRAATRGALDEPALERLAAGAHACTDCGRCSRGCPAGLDLADLWAASRDDLAVRGRPAAAVRITAVPAAEWAERLAAAAPATPPPLPASTALTGDRRTFSPCVQCQTCTNVCPVVACSAGDGGVDVTPQKVMNLLRLGLVDLAIGSRMVWSCATCYQCQEHCPAGIRVTDVLYELRNRGYAQLGAAWPAGPPAGRAA